MLFQPETRRLHQLSVCDMQPAVVSFDLETTAGASDEDEEGGGGGREDVVGQGSGMEDEQVRRRRMMMMMKTAAQVHPVSLETQLAATDTPASVEPGEQI